MSDESSFLQKHEIYDTYLVNEINKCFNIATQARSRGIDPTKEVEISIQNNIIERIKQSAGIEDIKGLEEDIREVSIVKIVEIVRNFINGKYGFYPLNELTINKALKLGLTLLTNMYNSRSTNFVTISIRDDEKNNHYFEINMSTFYKNLPSHIVFLSLLLVEELRKTCNYSKPSISKISHYIELLDRYQELVVNSRDQKIIEATKLVINNLNFIITFDHFVNPLNMQPTQIKYYLREMTKLISRIFLKGIKRNINVTKKINGENWLWLQNLNQYVDAMDNTFYITLCDSKKGGFSLRIGEAQNTFHNFIGIHPSLFEVFNDIIYEGCNAIVKLNDKKIKGCKLVAVDSLSPPVIKLNDGSTIKLTSISLSRTVKSDLKKILSFGDILISSTLLPARIRKKLIEDYSDEVWLKQIQQKIHLVKDHMNEKTENRWIKLIYNESFYRLAPEDIIKLVRESNTPVPSFLCTDWNNITPEELKLIYEQITNPIFNKERKLSVNTHTILDKLSIEYQLLDQELIVSEVDFRMLTELFNRRGISIDTNRPINDILQETTGLRMIPKFYVGLLIPQTLHAKINDDEYHGVNPGSSLRMFEKYSDIISFCKDGKKVNTILRYCITCDRQIPYNKCPICDNETIPMFYCKTCNNTSKYHHCQVCGNEAAEVGPIYCDWNKLLTQAIINTHVQPYVPLLGINNSNFEFVERLEKPILRQKYNIKISTDGVTKFYVKTVPLGYFMIKQILADKHNLIKLGYNQDIFNKTLQTDDQILSIKLQDIIVPYRVADQLRQVADFIDETLVTLYKQGPFYKIRKIEDLIGHLLIGVTKGNNCGSIGRIIGFTEADTCFCNPLWMISVKGSTNENDDLAIMLLMDALINFSKRFFANQAIVKASPQYLQLTNKVNYNSGYTLVHFNKFNPERSIQNGMNEKEKTTNNTSNSDLTNTFAILWSDNLYLAQSARKKKERNIIDLTQIQLSIVNRSINLSYELIKNILKNHLTPLLKRQLNQYRTTYKCQSCNKKYRRPLIKNMCIVCGKRIEPIISLDTIENTYNFILETKQTLNPDQSMDEELIIIKENISLLKYGRKQSTLLDY